MPFCPECRMGYRAEFTRCPDCDVDLVESLPKDEEVTQPEESGAELVELATFPNTSEAEMIQELLEDNGIRTVLRGDVDPLFVGGASPSTLLVEQADLERARAYYEDFFAGDTEEVLEDEDASEDTQE
ncbi:MAG: DUF2007 domain-containing protein [Acidobacteriia bacterium]|nr:DUF2007 domain-containing protein [Terriglobia bacterium]